jgi:hypothetical protein
LPTQKPDLKKLKEQFFYKRSAEMKMINEEEFDKKKLNTTKWN